MRMARMMATAMWLAVIGIGLSACYEPPPDGSHSAGYNRGAVDYYPREDYQRPYEPAYPPPRY